MCSYCQFTYKYCYVEQDTKTADAAAAKPAEKPAEKPDEAMDGDVRSNGPSEVTCHSVWLRD